LYPATIIAIEGPDKVGKQTQAALLVTELRDQGWKVKPVEMPVNDVITYRLIYWMLRNSTAKRFPRIFQAVQFLNKYLWQLFVCPFLNWKYDYVVMDRWAASATVYGRATGISERFLQWTYNRLTRPDATLVLMGPSHCAERADDSYEKDTELQANVRVEYDLWSLEEGFERVTVLSNQGGREAVHAAVMDAIGPKGHDLL
jgi:thymidylate kinase